MGCGIIRFEFYCHVIVFNGTVKIAFSIVSKTPIVIGLGITKIDLYRCAKVFNSTVKIALFCGKRSRDCYKLRPSQALIVLLCQSL